MQSGSWDEATNTRAFAYVAGIGGWWDGKLVIEVTDSDPIMKPLSTAWG